MEATFNRWDRNLINYDGSCGDPANGYPPQKGGLDAILDWMFERYAAEPEDEEEDDVNDFETWPREPGSSIKAFILDFEQRYQIAEATGQVAHNNKYMTKLFFQKGKFSEQEKYDILKEVGADPTSFEGIKKAARTLMTLKEKKTKLGTYHTQDSGAEGVGSAYYAPQSVSSSSRSYYPGYQQSSPVMHTGQGQYFDPAGGTGYVPAIADWTSPLPTYQTADNSWEEDSYIWFDVENFDGTSSHDYDCGAVEIFFDNNDWDETSSLPIYAATDTEVWYDVDTEWCFNDELGEFWVDEENEIHFGDEDDSWYESEDDNDVDWYDEDEIYHTLYPNINMDDANEWEEVDDGFYDDNNVYVFRRRWRRKGKGKGKGLFRRKGKRGKSSKGKFGKGKRRFGGFRGIRRGRFNFRPRWRRFSSRKGFGKGKSRKGFYGGNGSKGKPGSGKGKGKGMIRRKGKGKGKGKGTCNLCGAPDHWQDQCPLNQGKGRPAPVRTTQHASPLQRTWWTGPTFLLGFITCCMPEFQLSSGLIFTSKETIVFPWSERLFTTTTDFNDLYANYLKYDYVSTYSMKPMNVWNDPDNYYWKESRWIMPDTPLIDSVSTAENDKIKTTQVLVFSQLGDNETWETSWRTLLEYHGHALLMDTGAAKNLAGSYTLKD